MLALIVSSYCQVNNPVARRKLHNSNKKPQQKLRRLKIRKFAFGGNTLNTTREPWSTLNLLTLLFLRRFFFFNTIPEALPRCKRKRRRVTDFLGHPMHGRPSSNKDSIEHLTIHSGQEEDVWKKMATGWGRRGQSISDAKEGQHRRFLPLRDRNV